MSTQEGFSLTRMYVTNLIRLACTNTLAYLSAASITNLKSFVSLTPIVSSRDIFVIDEGDNTRKFLKEKSRNKNLKICSYVVLPNKVYFSH